jgi:hypothetical protein
MLSRCLKRHLHCVLADVRDELQGQRVGFVPLVEVEDGLGLGAKIVGR